MSKPVDPERMAQRFASSRGVPYQDALQDVRISIIEHTRKWETLSPTPGCSFDQWLYNKVFQQLRHRYTRRMVQQSKVKLVTETDLLGVDAPGLRYDGEADQHDPATAIDVQEALTKLNPAHRELLVEVGMKGVKLSEYAERKGVTQTAVNRMWDRAAKQLKALLPDYDPSAT